MIPRYRVFHQRLAAELKDVEHAAQKAVRAYKEAGRAGVDATFYLDSVALNLHSVYNGIERIFEWIARELDGGLPAGSTWHRDLLSQMTLDVEGVRPPVIRPETAQQLDEYLRFRHLVRNLYTWNFEEDKLRTLIAGLPQSLAALRTDLATFGDFLEAANQADEPPER